MSWSGRTAILNGDYVVTVLHTLLESPTGAVPYLELMRKIKPHEVSSGVLNLRLCPPQLAHARRVINALLGELGVPAKVKAIRRVGLRLAWDPQAG